MVRKPIVAAAALLAVLCPAAGQAAPLDPGSACGNLHAAEVSKYIPPSAQWRWVQRERLGDIIDVRLEVRTAQGITYYDGFRCRFAKDGSLLPVAQPRGGQTRP
jgi:hypothetical protein